MLSRVRAEAIEAQTVKPAPGHGSASGWKWGGSIQSRSLSAFAVSMQARAETGQAATQRGGLPALAGAIGWSYSTYLMTAAFVTLL